MTTHPTDGGDKGVDVMMIRRFEQAPCYLCGYNGPNYYQPDTHACAKQYHEHRDMLSMDKRSLVHEILRLRSLAALAESKAGESVAWPEEAMMYRWLRENEAIAILLHCFDIEAGRNPDDELDSEIKKAAGREKPFTRAVGVAAGEADNASATEGVATFLVPAAPPDAAKP